MPYLANFSSNFYEKLGHDVADELVAWLKQVYHEKRETDLLRRQVEEILREVRELRLHAIRQGSS